MSDDETIIANPGEMSILQQPAQRRAACLVQYSGAQLGKRFPLDNDSMTIGRSPQTDICIDEPSVSRRHSKFSIKGENVSVEDLGSSNGTYVNDKRLEGSLDLNDQDMLRLGTILFKFFANENIDGIIHDKIYRMATIDAGTQIFNKEYLLDTLKSEFKFSKAYHHELSVIYYDLDHFKKVNDTYGHAAGDHILKEGAQVIKKALRKTDILCRFGGEEFIVILPNTNAEKAIDLTDRVRVAMENHIFDLELDENGAKRIVQHRQTISLGVSQFEPEMESEADLLESADKKLYISKKNGRNKVTA